MMNRIQRWPGVLAGLAVTLLALAAAAPAALAAPATFPPPDVPQTGTGPQSVTRTVVIGGMPGWQIILIATAAALIGAVAAVLLDRAWAARRNLSTRAV
jgi:hypothetical protein